MSKPMSIPPHPLPLWREKHCAATGHRFGNWSSGPDSQVVSPSTFQGKYPWYAPGHKIRNELICFPKLEPGRAALLRAPAPPRTWLFKSASISNFQGIHFAYFSHSFIERFVPLAGKACLQPRYHQTRQCSE